MPAIEDALSNITGKQTATLQLARRALMISNDNNRIVMEILLVENRGLVENLLSTRSENSKEITALVEESERRCESEEEKHLLSAVKRTRKPYLDADERAIHLLVDERKHDEAESVMVRDAEPVLLPGRGCLLACQGGLLPMTHSCRPRLFESLHEGSHGLGVVSGEAG